MNHDNAVPLRRSNRSASDGPAHPVRLVHLGLGAFFRAHQAWYTHLANAITNEDWGYVVFTGRTADQALLLAPQDGLYTLLTRSPHGDEASVVTCVSIVHDISDNDAWLRAVSDPAVVVRTLTITEAGYGSKEPKAVPKPAINRLVHGLVARRAAGVGGLALVSCDNLPSNGDVLCCRVLAAARLLALEAAEWILHNVTFPNPMVDRITPATTQDELNAAESTTGFLDKAAVVAEPFAEWVIQDRFPEGRPRWHAAGAQFVDDVGPYERRKLFLLNGGHSILAYFGSLLGHEDVHESITDPQCLRQINRWWDEVSPLIGLPVSQIVDYRQHVLE